MGHERCGAVTAAVELVNGGGQPAEAAFTRWSTRSERCSSPASSVDDAVRANALAGARALPERSAIVAAGSGVGCGCGSSPPSYSLDSGKGRAAAPESGASKSANQRVRSCSIGSSFSSFAFSSSSLRVVALLSSPRHERPEGAALEAVDPVDRLLAAVERKTAASSCVAEALRRQLRGDQVDGRDEILEVGVAHDRATRSRTRPTSARPWSRTLGGGVEQLLIVRRRGRTRRTSAA